jgi:hypothetical protein
MAAYRGNGGTRTHEENRGNGQQTQDKNRPVFVRKIFTPSGTLELAVFEKEINGKKSSYLNYFVTLNRSYPDPQNDGKYIDTTVMNPQDLLIVADFYKQAWDFILEQCNRE